MNNPFSPEARPHAILRVYGYNRGFPQLFFKFSKVSEYQCLNSSREAQINLNNFGSVIINYTAAAFR